MADIKPTPISQPTLKRKTKKKPQSQLNYEKEIRRIRRQALALLKRGYDVSALTIPKTLKGAKNLTLEKIYEKATYEIEGKTVPGTKGRIYERKQAAKKASVTRKSKRTQFIQKKSQGTKPNYPKKSDVILGNLLDYFVDTDTVLILLQMLENSDASWGYTRMGTPIPKRPAAREAAEEARVALLELLQNEIHNTSLETVAYRIENSANGGDLIPLVESILHGYDSDEDNNVRMIQSSYQLVASIIKGEMLTADETEFYSNADAEGEGFFNE